MDIQRLIENVQALAMRQTLEESFYATSKALVYLQRLQWLHGENSAGGKIGAYKKIPYAVKKFAENPLAGYKIVDLKLTGAFYADTFVDIRTDTIVLESADSKTPDLITRYGPEILGLNEKYAGVYSTEHLAPDNISRIIAKIHR